ncbi:hypothetical protein TELCIR_00884 [Teladorsagia circumcincta]|uniref:PDZ domain-containing protein n=1 Tax=Teladorsagia circumcincta TaxID=45464 RepID=A0A2G9V3E9_TELCI|nr:hypothetical protein TELCIR_00884 [Teladorsagia circumcincta]
MSNYRQALHRCQCNVSYFGIVLGCKFYIKEIRNPKLAEKDPGLREGDSVLRINGQSVDGSTLEEVNKWLERSYCSVFLSVIFVFLLSIIIEE